MVDGVISDSALLGRAEFSDGGSIQDIGFFSWVDSLKENQEKQENGFCCEVVRSSGGITCERRCYVGKLFFLIMLRLLSKALSLWTIDSAKEWSFL